MARAIGCSEASSTAPARTNRESPSRTAADDPSTRVPSTESSPLVTVPVLSSRTVFTRRVSSRTWADLMRIPSWAPRPVPVNSAVGVARPRAHGQAITRTETPATNAGVRAPPIVHHRMNVRAARTSTIGTNTAEIRSARRATGALDACASATRRPICASVVPSPTRVARTRRRPLALRVAPVTLLPGPTSTGTDSPVSMDSSTAESPSTTTPSVAIFSPGRTTNSSSTRNSSTGMRTGSALPERTTSTSRAPRSSSLWSASLDRDCARVSVYRPISRKNVTTAAVSK
jgi:hypothetical protein